jgi:hypothetical protein
MDWIARHGGMALVNVHPDYVRFAGESPTASTFTVEHYVQLLKHVQSSHSGRFWHALPAKVAAHWKQSMPQPQLTGGEGPQLSP